MCFSIICCAIAICFKTFFDDAFLVNSGENDFDNEYPNMALYFLETKRRN